MTRSMFAALPVELQIKILLCVIQTDPSSLLPLLTAFPELSSLVMIINDHSESPYALLNASGCASAHFEDHVVIESLSRTRPIKVLSFIKCEEEAGLGKLTRDPTCPYGRYISPASPVFVGVQESRALGKMVIEDLVRRRAGASQMIQFVNVAMAPDSNHFGLHGPFELGPELGSILELRSKWIPRITWTKNPNNPVILSLPFFKSCHFLSLNRITRLTITRFWCFGVHIEAGLMFDVKNFRMSSIYGSTDGCRAGTIDGEISIPCKFPLVGIKLALHLENFYLEYETPRMPIIWSTPMTSSKVTKNNGIFTCVNLAWSLDDPCITPCPHALECGEDSASWAPSIADIPPMGFTSHFSHFNLVGTPDVILEIADLSNAETMVWKRHVPVVSQPTIQPPEILNCSSLTDLSITTLLRSRDETKPMPIISAPSLKTLNLVSASASTEPWNLPLHFTMETLRAPSLARVVMEHIVKERDPLVLTIENIEPIMYTEGELSVKGYNCLFTQQDLRQAVGNHDTEPAFKRVVSMDIMGSS